MLDKIGTFLNGQLMGVFPNEYEYCREAYAHAQKLSEVSQSFVEVRLFDSVEYTEIMESIKKASTISEEEKEYKKSLFFE